MYSPGDGVSIQASVIEQLKIHHPCKTVNIPTIYRGRNVNGTGCRNEEGVALGSGSEASNCYCHKANTGMRTNEVTKKIAIKYFL